MMGGVKLGWTAAWGLLALVCVAVVVTGTWPAALHADTHLAAVGDNADVQVGIYWPRAFAAALVELEPPFFRPDLNWPEGQDTRLLLWNYVIQLVAAPLFLVAGPVTAVNLLTFGLMVLNGLAGAWAAREVVAAARGERAVSADPVLLASMGSAAAVLALNAYTYVEGATGRPEQTLLAPMAVYLGGLVRLRHHHIEGGRPGARRSGVIICAVSLALAGAGYWFYAYFLVVLTLVLAAVWLVQRRLSLAQFVDLAAIGLGSAVLAAPFLWPVASAMADQPAFYGAMEDTAGGSAMFQQARAALRFPHDMLGGIGGPIEPQSWRMPLLLVPVCVGVAWWGAGAGRLVAGVGLGGAVCALGPFLLRAPGQPFTVGEAWIRLPMAVLDLLPGFTRFWWPYRFQGLALVGMAGAVAWLVSYMGRRRGRRWALTLAGGLVALTLFDCAAILRLSDTFRQGRTHPAFLFEVQVPQGFVELGTLDGERPVAQFPLGQITNGMVGWAAWHGQPLDSGIAWDLGVTRTAGWTERRATSPLMLALDAIAGHQDPEVPEGGWTTQSTGGFHYIAQYPGPMSLSSDSVARGLAEAFGLPFYCDADVALYAIPGVGEVPPGLLEPWQEAVATGGDPCAARLEHLPGGAPLGPADGALGPADGAQGPPRQGP